MSNLEQANVVVRRSQDRGKAHHGWLESAHTFSFANYYDPQHMGFRALRVINQDVVQGGMGFGAHPHRDMEILSFVVSGALEHQDSMGTRSVIQAGEVQLITAGTGIVHSEYNAHAEHPVEFLQIWIEPGQVGLHPAYSKRKLDDLASEGGMRLVASPDCADGALQIHQDSKVYVGEFQLGQNLNHIVGHGRGVWIQVVSGSLVVAGKTLAPGDGISAENIEAVTVEAEEASMFLLFDLA